MMTHVDVLLGVAMVMLGVSLLVTIATQLVSFVLNLRGAQLERGLVELFKQLEIGSAEAVVQRILKHPLVADGGWRSRIPPAIAKVDLINLIGQAEPYLKLPPATVEALARKKKEIEAWFDAAMSRVTHRFTVRTRIITAIGAVLAAFLLHLDSFGLITRLYADSELRAQMSGAATGLIAKSEVILAGPTVYADAASKLREAFPALPAPEKPPQSRAEIAAWIAGAKLDQRQADAIDAKAKTILNDAVKPQVEQWFTQLSAVDEHVASTGLKLVPDTFAPWRFDSFLEFLGVLTSAILLSLGAPFWFNLLKTLSSFRPVLAAAVGAREEHGGKDGQSGSGVPGATT